MNWDLLDLAMLGDLARERGMGHGANWRTYPDFPAPVVRLSSGLVYSRIQVWLWQEARWPHGTRRAASVRRAPDPRGGHAPRPWDVADLAAPGDIAARRGAHRSDVSHALSRTDAPRPLLDLSAGPVYSWREIEPWAATIPRRRTAPGPAGAGRRHRPAARPTRATRWGYQQITDDLRRRVVAGEWPAGGRLPSRIDLAAAYQIGERLMARPILQLCDEGLLVTRAGSGTYVAEPPA